MSRKKPTKLPDPLEKYSARIKNLYIELNDYGYFHSPSEIEDIDPRFTGRKEVLERLKSLFTDHQTPSGAYLVTGYRGAGKSSLVARALSEISTGHQRRRRGSRYLRLFAPLPAFAILGGFFSASWVILILAILSPVFLIWLSATDPKFPDRQENRGLSSDLRRERLWCVLRCLYLTEEREPRGRARILAQDGLLLCLVLLFGGIWINWLGVTGFWSRFTIYSLGLLVYLGLNLFVSQVVRNSVEIRVQPNVRPALPEAGAEVRVPERLWDRPWWQAFKEVFCQAFRAIKNRLRYANRVYIKVNLSQDDIQEADILRLIVKNVYLRYRTLVRGWRSDLFWKITRIVMLSLIVWVVYNLQLVTSLNYGLKHDLHVSCYLPSQGAYYFSDTYGGYFRTVESQLMNGTFDGQSLREGLEKHRKSSPSKESSRLGTDEHAFRHPSHAWSWKGRLQLAAMDAATYFDTFVQLLYYKLVPSLPKSISSLISDPFKMPLLRAEIGAPKHIDYLYFIYLTGFALLLQVASRWPKIGLVSHREILRRLEELNEMIDAQVTREQGGVPVPGSLLTFSFGRRRSRTSMALNARDIEKHLLEILEMIERIPRLTVRPEFIVIFDELDKIQHQVNFTLSEKDRELDEYQGREFTSMEAERARQHRILSLVSNLKHFLTTAPAKFIFIAGREMFDAALADVSDRHFFMGSVFNEVLHVPSFHSDNSDDRLPDITSLTEQYLCRFLLPRRLWPRGICLRTYHHYLREELLPDDDQKDNAPAREKVIYQLHNFITYVTYRSNGAPKKITKAVERYLMRLRPEISEHPDSLVVGRSSHSFYLYFEYYDQYTFDLITYLGSPLIFALNRTIKDYGDKILVSSSFLLDHIYKFHGHGFSWRNLELLPEIVDINRAPQLRELIGHIMGFLSKSDISEVASGLYDFKFNRRIVEEIAFLSKISEYESAAFNFTLDESLAIKRHFNHKLQVLLKTYQLYPNRKRNRFVNSVAFVRMILGDLHFYDGELDAAIIEYMEAVQALRDYRPQDMRLDTLVLMIRNFLKLGLAFERKKSFESALVTYSRVAAMIVEFGKRRVLDGRVHNDPEGATHQAAERNYSQTVFEGCRLIVQPMYARLQLTEKATLGGICQGDIDNIEMEFRRIIPASRKKERHLLASEFYDKLADILYFKNGPVPAQRENVYCQKEGAMCLVNGAWGSLVLEKRRSLPCSACSFYHEALKGLCTSYLGIATLERGRVAVQVLKSFEKGSLPKAERINSLLELAGTLSDIGNTFLSCSAATVVSEEYLVGLIRLLGKPTGTESSRSALLAKSVESLFQRECRGLNKTEESLTYFMVAAIIYRWASNSRASAQAMVKMLWVIREQLAIQPQRTMSKDTLIELEDRLVRATVEENYRSHEGTHRLEIEKLKEVFEISGKERPFVDSVNLGRLSINSATVEILVVMDEIRLSLANRGKVYPIDKRCSPHSMFHSVFSRVHALRLRARINFHNLRALGFVHGPTSIGDASVAGAEAGAVPTLDQFVFRKKLEVAGVGDLAKVMKQHYEEPEERTRQLFPDVRKTIKRREILEFLITDSIYCFHEIIRFIAIYGTSYMTSHTMRAAAHQNMAQWCDYYYAYLRVQEGPGSGALVRRLEEKLQNLVGRADMVDLSPSYHGEMALLHYRAAREVHSEGKAYKELMSKMYYLNDDFADQLEHFCAALERFRVNSGAIDRAIERWRPRLEATSIYEPDRYKAAGGAVVLVGLGAAGLKNELPLSASVADKDHG